MTDDIIERIRDFHGGDDPLPLLYAAEDEIERLRTRLALAETSIECFENDRVEAQAEIERLREALHRIRSWSEAYPLDIFPEPDWKKARTLLEAGGITLDAVAASCMRRCVEGIGKIARGALETDNARD